MKNRISRYFAEQQQQQQQQQQLFPQHSPAPSPFQILNKLFQSAFNPLRHEIKENDNAYRIRVFMSDVITDDLDLVVENRNLTLTVGNVFHRWTLPQDALLNHIKANLKEGVLTIIVPKSCSMQFKIDISSN